MKCNPRGQVLPLIALCLAMLLGFAGISVDVGFFEYRQQAQQSATDAAALGAAEQLVHSGCPSQASARAAGTADAASNGFLNAGNTTVTVNNPPTSGAYSGNHCAVSVSINTSSIPTYFSKFFGSNFASGATETTQAVGLVSYTGPGCIYLLSTTVQSDMTNLHINSPTCGIDINDSANFSNSTIAAASILYAGTGNNTSGTTFVDATPAPSLPFSDPCPEIPGCNYLANNPPPMTNCSQENTNSGVTLQGPVCYSSLQLGGSGVTVCGVIALTGQFHLNGATVSSCSSGVTFYMANGVSDTNFSTATLNLAAPTSGNTAGVLFYRVPSQSSAVDYSTCTCNLTGVVYYPTADVNVSNVGANYTVLIFGQGNFSTSSTFDDAIPTGGSYVGRAVLAQ